MRGLAHPIVVAMAGGGAGVEPGVPGLTGPSMRADPPPGEGAAAAAAPGGAAHCATGARANAWCLLIHADASLSLSLSLSRTLRRTLRRTLYTFPLYFS